MASQFHLSCLVLNLDVGSAQIGSRLRFVTLVLCVNFLVVVLVVHGYVLHYVMYELA